MFFEVISHFFVLQSYILHLFIQVSQVTSGPRRGPTFNNRWWNDRRSWNLRTTNSREKASPKGANHIQSCSCSPPSGTVESLSAIRRFHSLRSFHPRLFTFAPFGDGRMLLAKLEYFSVSKYDIFKYRIRCIITKKSGIIHAIVCPDIFIF